MHISVIYSENLGLSYDTKMSYCKYVLIIKKYSALSINNWNWTYEWELENTGIGSRPSDHYFRCVLFVCLFVQFFSAVFDPISIKLGHMVYVLV